MPPKYELDKILERQVKVRTESWPMVDITFKRTNKNATTKEDIRTFTYNPKTLARKGITADKKSQQILTNLNKAKPISANNILQQTQRKSSSISSGF